MSFKLVYLSQQDPQWKSDILGFGDPGDTIGYVGCALTSVSMLVSGHGYAETPKTLNQKLKSANGFVSSGIRWDVVSKVHPEITLKQNILCETNDAPLATIDAALTAGQPVVVRVDSSPAAGLQWHYVLIYARKGNDYLMLDPWPYQPGTAKEDFLMARYSQGNPLQRSIQQVLVYQCSTTGGTISVPASSSTSTPTPSTPAPASTPSSEAYARVKQEVTWGLNIRSSTDTSSKANVVANAPANSQLQLLDSDGASKIGVDKAWVRVRTQDGREGFAAAWYLDLVSAGTTPVATAPASSDVLSGVEASKKEAPAPAPPASSTPATTPTSPQPSKVETLNLKVSSSVGTSGLRLRLYPSLGGALIMILKAGTMLTALEPADKAKAKIGKVNEWIFVSEPGNRRGYVSAQYVELA